MRRLFCFILGLFLCIWVIPLTAQPFICQANKYLSVRFGNLSKIYEVKIDAQSGMANFEELPIPNVGVSLNAIGYRSTDNYIYGLDVQSKDLIRVNASGGGELIGSIPNLPPQYAYFGADCTPDGKYLVLIGSTYDSGNGSSKVLVYIDLANPNNPTQTVTLNTSTEFYSTDIAFHPIDGLLYGFDELENRMFCIDSSTGKVEFKDYPTSPICDALGAVFFDSFGTFYGYGNDLNATDARSLFRASVTDGVLSKIASGPATIGKDACSCPYTVELQKEVFPKAAFPCTMVEYVFTLSNITDVIQTGIELNDQFPPGLTFVGGSFDNFGGQLISVQGDDFFEIQNMNIPPGIHEIAIEVYIEDYVEGIVKNQAILLGLPENLGSEQLSDDPSTGANSDSTSLLVQPLFVDLAYDTFTFCQTDELLLEATTFGASYEWQDGSTLSTFTATTPGEYSVTISTACEIAVDSVVVLAQEIVIVQEEALQLELGNSIQLSPLIFSNVDYSLVWIDPQDNTLSCLQCPEPFASPIADTDYIYKINTGEEDCDLEGKVSVEVLKYHDLYIPNVFSPDNNGGNDTWEIFGRQPFRILELQIFSRWGEELAEISTTNFARSVKVWDGKLNQKSMQPAVFVWQGTFEFLDGTKLVKSGDFALLR